MSEINGVAPKLILASGSRSRRDMLKAAGISFEIIPADVDEPAIREVFASSAAAVEPSDIATILASAKAETVSAQRRDALVIGADQVLALDGEIFDKPTDMTAAAARLLALRGRTHQLHAAVTIAIGGQVQWSICETAHLTMRDFSPEFVGRHLAQVGTSALESVGAYQLEARGVHLFEKIEGDYFTILGLPMLPLLQELRQRGCIE